MRTTHIISEKNINIQKSKEAEYVFLEECFKEDDFKMFIAQDGEIPSDYSILSIKGEKIGCALFTANDLFGIVSVELTIYIKKEFRFLSISSILSCFKYIINSYVNVEKIVMRVYKFNQNCLELFQYLDIKPEIILPCKFNDKNTELYYFGICVEDIWKYKEKLYGKLKI